MDYNNLINFWYKMACFCESQIKKIFVNHKLDLVCDSQTSFGVFVIHKLEASL